MSRSVSAVSVAGHRPEGACGGLFQNLADFGFGLAEDAIHSPNESYGLDQFRKGVHTFTMEYTLTAAGTYSLGIATIQSAYAPELNAHSAADVIRVK